MFIHLTFGNSHYFAQRTKHAEKVSRIHWTDPNEFVFEFTAWTRNSIENRLCVHFASNGLLIDFFFTWCMCMGKKHNTIIIVRTRQQKHKRQHEHIFHTKHTHTARAQGYVLMQAIYAQHHATPQRNASHQNKQTSTQTRIYFTGLVKIKMRAAKAKQMRSTTDVFMAKSIVFQHMYCPWLVALPCSNAQTYKQKV